MADYKIPFKLEDCNVITGSAKLLVFLNTSCYTLKIFYIVSTIFKLFTISQLLDVV